MKSNLRLFSISLFFSLYLILPTYFAIEINQSLPLITASRVVILICAFFVLRIQGWQITIIKMNSLLKIYFLLFIIVNCIHIYDTGAIAVNRLFVILYEQLLVLWIIMNLINDRFTFIKSIKVLLFSSALIAIVSIIGFIFDTNFFYFLKTVSREMTLAGTTDIGYRSGLLRVEAGFGHPVYYAIYCSLMIFISFHMYNYSKNNFKYLIYFLLNVCALLLTNSRGVILAVIATFLLLFLFNNWSEKKKYMKFVMIFVILLTLASFFSSSIRLYVSNIFKSIYVYFGFSDLKIENYGANLSFSNDRLMQFSGILWTLKKSPLIGFGYNAHLRGMIKYYFSGHWFPAISFDVGFVEIVCCYGIIGSIAFIFLWKNIIDYVKYIKHTKYYSMFKAIFLVYFLGLFSVVNIDKIFWVIFGLLCAYVKVIRRENQQLNI